MKSVKPLFLIFVSVLFLSGCETTELGAHVGKQVFSDSVAQGTFKVGNPYKIEGVNYYPKETYSFTETGVASWYGPGFHGKKTANGEIFSKHELTAAHRTLQMPSLIEVTNLSNGKSVILRVNDRGPFARSRILDVSERAAELLEFKNHGTAKIRIRLLAQESKEIADIARQGKSTRGMENAYNNGQRHPVTRVSHVPTSEPFEPPPKYNNHAVEVPHVQRQVLADPLVPGHTDSTGRFLPDPVVTNTINPTGRIYVQAGSFGNSTNANSLSGKLGSIAPSHVAQVDVNGTVYHRVRLGPFPNMAQAQSALNRISAGGHSNAMIVVE